jgi:hypothetical protein
LKTISQKIRNENFQVDFILQYCDKPLWTLRGIEKNLSGETTGNSMLDKRQQDSFFFDTFAPTGGKGNKNKLFNNPNGTNNTNTNTNLNFQLGNQTRGRMLGNNANGLGVSKPQIGLLESLSMGFGARGNNGGPLAGQAGPQNASLFDPISNQVDFMKSDLSMEDDLPEEVEELCNYRIFNGNFHIELKGDQKSKKLMPSVKNFSLNPNRSKQ